MKTLILGGMLAGALVVAGCAAEAPQPESTAAPEAAVEAPAAEFEPAVSINQVMVDLINESATDLWDVDLNPPATDDDWIRLRSAAVALAAGGSITAMGGNGPNDEAWSAQGDWVRLSQAMTDVGVEMLTAVERRNLDQLGQRGDELVTTCVNCHEVYRLDVPQIWSERAQVVPEASAP